MDAVVANGEDSRATAVEVLVRHVATCQGGHQEGTTAVLSEQQIETFQRDGFLTGSVILSDERIEELRAELDRVIAEQDRANVAQPVSVGNLGGVEESPVWQVVNIWEGSTAFREIRRPGTDVYITPTGADVHPLIDAGADVVAPR